MSEGIIFDIKKYSINDGPGIRTTVFFKGCPLRCPWCHNPEGQSFFPEVMLRPSRCLPECFECVAVCDPGALSKQGIELSLVRDECTLCRKCADICPSRAIEFAGRQVSVAEVMAEIEKDRIFYEQSWGGVTFSGGEPLAQPDFLAELLAACRKKGFHTTVDTCGYAPEEALDRAADQADLFLYDLKIMDENKHDDLTGQPNSVILKNLKRLARRGKKVIVRLPLIPGINDDDQNIRATTTFLNDLKGISEISLLPYHKLGLEKRKSLEKKRPAEVFSPPATDRLEKIKADLESAGFSVRLGE
jgi:pyruvate formate lyase activating enzyme